MVTEQLTLMLNQQERYINPYTDFGFKKLFGTEMNKELLVSFLNALLSKSQPKKVISGGPMMGLAVSTLDVPITKTTNAITVLLEDEVEQAELMALASSMEEAIKSQLFVKTIIGIGGVAEHLRELADSYKEAQVAIEVGKVFDTEKNIINYENLGIGRLIYQLPTTLCEIFLSEVFKKNSIDTLDQETLFTINKFFENNLNVSETSRKLFVHRNTLVYRLEKIKKLTGLDLREFDHAIIFKVALMVKKYLNSRENRML